MRSMDKAIDESSLEERVTETSIEGGRNIYRSIRSLLKA